MPGEACKGKDREAEGLPSAENRYATGGLRGVWRSSLPGAFAKSHSPLIVAWGDIVRHTSAYKRNPLFDRWVPALITSTLKGLLITLAKVIRGSFRSDTADHFETSHLRK